MSSVRISPHHRPGAEPIGSGGESRVATAPSGGANFALTLGAAAVPPKPPGAPSSAMSDTTDGGKGSRKRAGNDGKGGDPAAMLAVPESLLAAVGQVAILPRDTADIPAAPPAASHGGIKLADLSGATQANEDPASNFATAAAVDSPGILPSVTPTNAPARTEVKTAPGPAPDILAADPASADPSMQSPDLTANAGLQPQLTPNASPVQLPSTAPVMLAQALPAMTTGQPGAGNENPPDGGEDHRRFAPISIASEGSRTGEPAALGALVQTPGLASASGVAASPTAVADAAGNPTISDQVAGHVVRLVTGGSREMVMRLHPPELGEVTVRVAVSGRDVSAWFGSPQPQVQLAIADGIGQLQTGLGDAGYNLNGAWVGADASGARQQAGNLPLPPAPSAAAPAAGFGLTAASRPPASGLNIYV